MFIFGTTALEQFMERVIEWPQYCNHILQISHLRGTRSRLVLEIEQELNKISVSQNDTNLNAMIPEDQRVSVTQFTENAEVFTTICCKNYRLFLLVVCHFNLSKLTIIFWCAIHSEKKWSAFVGFWIIMAKFKSSAIRQESFFLSIATEAPKFSWG
jgi:hypothetical protein